MASKRSQTLSLLGRELGQFLLIGALGIATLRLTQHFWHEPLTMLAGTTAIVAMMLLVKRSLAITLTGLGVGIVGPVAEMQAVRAGAWSYASAHIEGVPAWLFLVWCTVGIFVASTYEFLRVLIAQAEAAGANGP